MASAKKRRLDVPSEVAAQVLFLSDRTCCVCHAANKQVQIHHIDDDPSNNALVNLSVLCLECHALTQIKGGFGRKLDPAQVTLYRDDWIRVVGEKRATDQGKSGKTIKDESFRIEWAIAVAEIYREEGRFVELALHYDSLGQLELRDKYVEEVLKHEPSDHDICLLRGRQGRPDLVPAEVVERRLKHFTEHKNLVDRGFLYLALGRYREAAMDWIDAVQEDLEEQNEFTAAIYMKRLVERGVVDQLFVSALKKAREDNDVWWQVRALEELGWSDDLRELLLANAESIEESDNLQLKQKLARARGDNRKVVDLGKEIASVGLVESFGSRAGVGPASWQPK